MLEPCQIPVGPIFLLHVWQCENNRRPHCLREREREGGERERERERGRERGRERKGKRERSSARRTMRKTFTQARRNSY